MSAAMVELVRSPSLGCGLCRRTFFSALPERPKSFVDVQTAAKHSFIRGFLVPSIVDD
jgi:hypothetical protein